MNSTSFSTTRMDTFRFWCQKIIPLVYDDSLSYYELLCKVVKYINDLIDNDNAIVEEINELIQKIADMEYPLEKLYEEFNKFKNEINSEMDSYENEVNGKINLINTRLVELVEFITSEDNRILAICRSEITENNEYLLNEMVQFLSNILVLNYFTGEYVSIQDMFNYLANLHTTDALTYTELIAKDITYTELAAYDVTYTDFAIHSGTIVV